MFRCVTRGALCGLCVTRDLGDNGQSLARVAEELHAGLLLRDGAGVRVPQYYNRFSVLNCRMTLVLQWLRFDVYDSDAGRCSNP